MDQPFSATPSGAVPAKPLAGLAIVLFVATVIGGWLYVDSVRNELEMKIDKLQSRAVLRPGKEIEKPQVKLVFEPSTVKVGDKVGDWTVTAVEGNEPGYPDTVAFTGSAIVMGTYTHLSENEPFFGGMVIFQNDDASLDLIPSASTLPREGYSGKVFLFSESAVASNAFGPEGSTGSATVKISDYTVNLIEGEARDFVKSFRVVTKTASQGNGGRMMEPTAANGWRTVVSQDGAYQIDLPPGTKLFESGNFAYVQHDLYSEFESLPLMAIRIAPASEKATFEDQGGKLIISGDKLYWLYLYENLEWEPFDSVAATFKLR